MTSLKKPAVFLDRDGTILTERGYLLETKKMRFYPFVFSALRRLVKNGFKLVVITNQSAIGRGYLTEKKLSEIHDFFMLRLRARGIRLSGIYYCPHRPDASCRCRKPKPFLVKPAAKELSLDLSKSFIVGDQARDVELAYNSGAKGVLVLTGAGRQQRSAAKKYASHVSRNLDKASKWIVKK
jgi:D,D-heptose 1,7-bisphosphate phosphatase